MSDQRPKRETKFIEEATNSNMWQNAALIERLHEKGRVTKTALLDTITDLRRNYPPATTLENRAPNPTGPST